MYTKVLLTVIALMLCVLVLRPAMSPVPVEAQSAGGFYIEPGTASIRDPATGGLLGEGKVVINLNSGEIWGFPTHAVGSPYPVDPAANKPAVSEPIALGKLDLGATYVRQSR